MIRILLISRNINRNCDYDFKDFESNKRRRLAEESNTVVTVASECRGLAEAVCAWKRIQAGMGSCLVVLGLG